MWLYKDVYCDTGALIFDMVDSEKGIVLLSTSADMSRTPCK